ncbi:succinate dehydrogenase, hydrophobic membrane anchor protein [Arsenicitalea aurantiaca]|uniref:Succinate dehydrogenase hydrophobic membrane anchor subunit n=1 Tax=Arsenicitalea aurantiaca TaxID=1783274 RepID=A0A433X5G3_9HYPH|nr:succinate dehydrogenase, hydrophobic membrane anchor protein [Arsenicitalea aurantiaca]RUT29320.1 succinate dehydrogenase, hydrophobic membrane anchor protein [Arsenicitalea aurantiaca]
MSERISKANIADPKTSFGSGRAATRHFMTQRLTAMANIAFTLFFVWMVVRLAGAERADMVAVLANPFVAIVTALLIVNVAVHMRIGMLEVIEDYVHDARLNRFCIMLNTFFAILVAGGTILALVKIVFWG